MVSFVMKEDDMDNKIKIVLMSIYDGVWIK